MQIQSAPPGPASLFSMSAFGRPDQQLLQDLQFRNQQTQQNMMSQYGWDTSAFFNSSAAFFNTYRNLTGMQQAETMITMGKVTNVGSMDTQYFLPVIDMAGFQKASLYQQTYLVANPFIQEGIQNGTFHGYKETYNHIYGDGIGMDNPVYRQAVSGLSLHSYGTLDDGVDDGWTECLDDPLPGLPALTAIEQSNIAQAWKLQAVLHSEGIDTTHPELKPIGD